MSEAVLVYLWGGLGNQLFQYAAGLAIAEAMGGQLYLLPAQENGHSARDYRRELMPSGRPADTLALQSTADTVYWPSDPHAPWSAAALAAQAAKAHPSPQRLLVRGYFQYLPAIRPQVARIRDELLERLIANTSRDLVAAPRQTAFLHVRRGDYTKLQGEGFHLLGADYYVPAIAAVDSAARPLKWLVFSDSPDWCAAQSWLPRGAEIVKGVDEVTTLALMSQCKAGAVISNSTFSWWGAILADTDASYLVAYPNRWIGDAKPALFPTNWIRI